MSLPFPCFDRIGKPVSVRSDEACFLLLQKSGKIEVHTPDGLFILRIEGSMDAFEIMLNPLGYERLDSGNLANVKKIIGVDREIWNAHFDNNLQTTISRGNRSKVKQIPSIEKKPRR